MTTDFHVETLDADNLLKALDELADILHAAVHGGASVNFVLPFTMNDSRAFWLIKALAAVRQNMRVLIIARDNGGILGTVQLDLDTPPNQPHRAEVTKLLVHPRARRRGIGRALMATLEQEARQRDRSLITLDTTSGSAAETLYRSLDYQIAGSIPGYSLAPDRQDVEPTTYLYKVIGEASA